MGCGPVPRRAGAATVAGGRLPSSGRVRVTVRPSGDVVVTVPGTMVLPAGMVPSTSSACTGASAPDKATRSAVAASRAVRTLIDAPVIRPALARKLAIGEHFFYRLHRRGARLPEIDEPAADSGKQEKNNHEETHDAVHYTFDLFITLAICSYCRKAAYSGSQAERNGLCGGRLR